MIFMISAVQSVSLCLCLSLFLSSLPCLALRSPCLRRMSTGDSAPSSPPLVSALLKGWRTGLRFFLVSLIISWVSGLWPVPELTLWLISSDWSGFGFVTFWREFASVQLVLPSVLVMEKRKKILFDRPEWPQVRCPRYFFSLERWILVKLTEIMKTR